MRYTIWSARVAVIAAVYAALTIAIAPLAYGEIQVRISDAMLILPLLPGFGWDAIVGLTLGGFLGNLASPFGYIDWIFGPLANFVASLLVYASKKIFGENTAGFIVGSLLAMISIALIIGYGELYLVFNIPSIVALYVFIGELISIGVGGGIVFYAWLKRARK
jgi:uncharacterized membrane protein